MSEQGMLDLLKEVGEELRVWKKRLDLVTDDPDEPAKYLKIAALEKVCELDKFNKKLEQASVEKIGQLTKAITHLRELSERFVLAAERENGFSLMRKPKTAKNVASSSGSFVPKN